MATSGDHPEWHVRIDREYMFNRPGQGAREKAAELAATRSELERYRERMQGRTSPEDAWEKGAVGEELVGRHLDRLPPDDWAVVHDLTIGRQGANLDHLVIGPPGVFAVNTKHLSGRVTVLDRAILQNGHTTRFVAQGRREATTVSARLTAQLGRPVPVRSVIVVVGPTMQVRARPADVTVLELGEMLAYFVYAPTGGIARGLRLTLERIARSPETWHPPQPRRSRVSPEHRPRGLASARSSTEPLDGILVRRWRRYGKDRLYVNTRQGESLGYRDLQTGLVHPTAPEHHDLVARATART